MVHMTTFSDFHVQQSTMATTTQSQLRKEMKGRPSRVMLFYVHNLALKNIN